MSVSDEEKNKRFITKNTFSFKKKKKRKGRQGAMRGKSRFKVLRELDGGKERIDSSPSPNTGPCRMPSE